MHPMASTVWRGAPYPLGATWDGHGVNFSLFTQHADGVELCLFDAKGRREIERIDIRERTNFCWHCYLPQARPGLLYGYRVHGPYAPEDGHRFNAHKLLLDPYAKSIVGDIRWSDAHYGYRVGGRREDLTPDRRDSAPGMPKCEVTDTAFSWGEDERPRTPWHDTIIYEMHVKGFTARNPIVPAGLRGSFAALATEPVIEYFLKLGVTAIELMPVHFFVDDRVLLARGLRNYWGYNTLGFFAPTNRYAAHATAINEFKWMVRSLHAHGLEVFLDVVYNHTAEGNHLGPTLAFRGIDNLSYYRLYPESARHYIDYTGVGNTLNMRHPRVLQLIMDSLRYWVCDMHVDGFRFDLAAALGREEHDVDPFSAFFDIIQQDPVLSQVKLIAEPWDLGDGGYQVGNFPPGWSEWNGRYRDSVRRYWKGDDGTLGELASRLAGSSDLYEHGGRRPYASINFVTAHDGFTLGDLVSYNVKHNEANGEDNRDGESNNLSWNCGEEGPTADPEIVALRARQKRNLLVTLLLSQGAPMLLSGDEIGRTQDGNNNAYCQDNETSWLDWAAAERDENRALLQFVRRLIGLRKRHGLFRRRNFFHGRPVEGSDTKDIVWLNPNGHEMTEQEWGQAFVRCLGMYLNGAAYDEPDVEGHRVSDANFALLMNAHHEEITFLLPQLMLGRAWQLLLDSCSESPCDDASEIVLDGGYPLKGRSLVLLMEQP